MNIVYSNFNRILSYLGYSLPSYLEAFVNMSYMYYSVLGAIVTVLVGSIVSLCTRDESDAYDKKLVHPMVLRSSSSKTGKVDLITVPPPNPVITEKE